MSGTAQRMEISQEAWEMARRPYHISVRRDDEDECYVAEVAEFPYLAGAEDTPEAAIETLREAMALTISGRMQRGQPIPEPQPVRA
jgi:predicted RNase H-like HicB family nuclease